MLDELKRFLVFMRLAFSRRATYHWFVVVFVGFILRTDHFGVSSIIRVYHRKATPACYIFSIRLPGMWKR